MPAAKKRKRKDITEEEVDEETTKRGGLLTTNAHGEVNNAEANKIQERNKNSAFQWMEMDEIATIVRLHCNTHLQELAAEFGHALRSKELPRGSQHAAIFKRLKNNIVAASHLGHRTSHALWGAAHSGKRRILSSLATHLKKFGNFLVLQLDGKIFQGDEGGATRKIINDIREFLFSSLSSPLVPGKVKREVCDLLRLNVENGIDEEDEDNESHSSGEEATRGREGKRRHEVPVEEEQDDNSDDDDDEKREKKRSGKESEDDTAYYFSSLEEYTISSVGMLQNLQHALIQLNQCGISLVVMINDISKFALWCDRLTYIIAGLMHECEERAGGISLLMASASSEIGLEKRLGSRISCELWYCPPFTVEASAGTSCSLMEVFEQYWKRVEGRREKIGSKLEEQEALKKSNNNSNKKVGAKKNQKNHEMEQQNKNATAEDMKPKSGHEQIMIPKEWHQAILEPLGKKLQVMEYNTLHQILTVLSSYFMQQIVLEVEKTTVVGKQGATAAAHSQNQNQNQQTGKDEDKEKLISNIPLLLQTLFCHSPYRSPKNDAEEEAARREEGEKRSALKKTNKNKNKMAEISCSSEQNPRLVLTLPNTKALEEKVLTLQTADVFPLLLPTTTTTTSSTKSTTSFPEKIFISREVFNLLFFVHQNNCNGGFGTVDQETNATGGGGASSSGSGVEKTLNDIYQQICAYLSSVEEKKGIYGDFMRYSRALFWCVQMNILQLDRKDKIHLVGPRYQVRGFLEKVLAEDQMAGSVGLDLSDQNKLKNLLH